MDEFSQNIISPINYLKIFFRRKEYFLVPIYAGLVLGICAGIILPKKYSSSTVMLVEEGKSDNPLLNNLAVSTTVTQRMTTIQESMLGWNSLVKTVKDLKMDKDVKSPSEFESLVMGVRRNITMRTRGANIIDLSYVGTDPVLTQAVVKSVTENFIERNISSQNEETADAIAFIEAQLKVYQGKIKSAEIAGLREQLNTLLVDSTEEHPKVKQLREEIQRKMKELEKEQLEYTDSATLVAQTTNPIIDEIKRALDGIDAPVPAPDKGGNPADGKDIYKVMLIDRLDNVMARDVNVNTSIYNMLLQRLETAKITQRLQASKEGTKYSILNPPRIPLRPFQPNKIMLMFMGLFMGGVVGASLVVAGEFLDKSFLDVEEAKECLGVPLLGAISKINTVDSISEERAGQRWFMGLTAISGVALIIVTVVISSLLR